MKLIEHYYELVAYSKTSWLQAASLIFMENIWRWEPRAVFGERLHDVGHIVQESGVQWTAITVPALFFRMCDINDANYFDGNKLSCMVSRSLVTKTDELLLQTFSAENHLVMMLYDVNVHSVFQSIDRDENSALDRIVNIQSIVVCVVAALQEYVFEARSRFPLLVR